MTKALIILSGGMDSTTLLYEYKEYIELAVYFAYGSKHSDKEVVCAMYHCEKLGIQLIIVSLPFINDYFKSDLLKSGGEIPEGHYEDESMKRTVVPFRNGIMLSIAAGLAESRGLNTLLIGNHSGDHAIYPDCRPEFITSMNAATQTGTYQRVVISSPYLRIDKRQIGLIGYGLGIEYEKTWTCYKGKDVHCGKCGSCTERKEALKSFDKTIYES